MKKQKRFLLISLVLGVTCSAINSFAQSVDVSAIKAKAKMLLEQNQKLQAEQQALLMNQAQLEGAIVERQNQEQWAVENGSAVRDLQQQEQKKIGEYRQQISTVENDVLVHQSKNLLLKQQLIDNEEQLRLLRLKAADLQYEQRTNDLGIRKQEINCRMTAQQQSQESAQLKQRLAELKEKEKEVLWQVNEIHEQHLGTTAELEQKMDEVSKLNQQYEELVSAKEELLKQKAAAQVEEVVVSKSQDQVVIKTQRQEELQADVAKLEAEHQGYDQAVRETVEQQSLRQKMVQEIIALDKENQMLRQQIASQKR